VAGGGEREPLAEERPDHLDAVRQAAGHGADREGDGGVAEAADGNQHPKGLEDLVGRSPARAGRLGEFCRKALALLTR
jgi:hypothetical protein